VRVFVLCFWSVLALLASGDKVSAQSREGGYGSFGIKGVTVLFMSDLQPPSSNSETADWLSASDDVIHRILYDKARSLNFGYDLRVEPVEGSTKVRVSVEPISRSAMNRVREDFDRSGKTMPEPSDILRYPAPQVVQDGDAFSLEIAVNRHTGVKLVDLLMVSRDQLKIQQFAEDQYPAREFTIDDVHMTMSSSKFLMNGNPIPGGGGMSGPVLGFVTPDRGRFLLSFRPYEGYAFRKAGVILVNKMTFTIDGDRFELVSTKPVMNAGGKWDLWVLHEPDYPAPASGWSFFATGLEKRSANP
jgi:hypothetical protein